MAVVTTWRRTDVSFAILAALLWFASLIYVANHNGGF